MSKGSKGPGPPSHHKKLFSRSEKLCTFAIIYLEVSVSTQIQCTGHPANVEKRD
eukprot:s701_g5.t1